MRHSALLWVLFLSLPAVPQGPSPAPPSGSQKQAAQKGEAAFTLERLYSRARFENDGGARREDIYWIKVLDEQAVRHFGEFPLAYQPDSEELAINEVSVQKPDGTVMPTPVSGIQDVSAMPGQLPIFVDLRQKVISVSALRPGDVLRVDAVWTVKKPIAPGQFWFDYSFNTKDVVRDEQLEVDVPADRAIALKLAPGAPAEANGGQGVTSGGRRIYTWKTSRAATAAKEPEHQPGEDWPAADVRLSSFRNWDEFGRWFTPLAIAKPDAAVKAKADSLTAGARDEQAKVDAIYRFVSTQIRYVSLSFGLGRFAAHAPADVLKNQYGDCKDKAVLIGALLDAVGVKAVPVLLNTTRSIAGDFASPLEFDHMISMVPKSTQRPESMWMDATIEVAPLGMLAFETRDKRVLTLDGSGHATVARTPLDPPYPSTFDLSVDGAVDAIGVLTAKVTMALRGDRELAARGAVRALPRENLKDFVEALAQATGLDGDVSDAATTDPIATADPFRITFHLRHKDALNWAAASSELKVAVKPHLAWTSADDRKDLHRIPLGAPSFDRRRLSLDLPVGYEGSAPAAISVTRVGISYTSSYSVDGRHLTVSRDLTTTAREIPESAFGEYSALARAVDADTSQVFKVRGTVSGTPVVPPGATSGELYGAANAAWYAKRYDAAAALYKASADADPKNGDAWIGLGLAYEQLEKYADAEAAIRKQIELDPFNKRAYSDLGSVLKSAGKTSDAIAAYGKHVELNPLDGAAFKELGVLDDDLDRFADEIVALEKAAALVKPDAWVYADLGTAYMLTKHPDEARRNFDRALELESTPALWTKVAWSLAEGGIDLDRAEELARKSEKQIIADSAAIDVKSATSAQLDRTGTLAWTWDAIGWIRFQRGDLAAAQEYTHAAWLLGGYTRTASHMGQVYQKRDKLADALSFYLTAESMTNSPTPEMLQRVKSLAGGGDLKLMVDAARRMLPSYRYVRLSSGRPSGTPQQTAQFLVVLTNDHKAIDVRFEGGAESVRPEQDALRSAWYQVEVPGPAPARVLVVVNVACDAKQVCAAFVEYPNRAKLKKQPN